MSEPNGQPGTTERVSLAWLTDRFAVGREDRGRDFVRDLAAWLSEHGRHLALPLAARLGLRGVVVTLQMKSRVTLVVTGHLEDAPGEITVRVDERDFPHVELLLCKDDLPEPYTFCTLDYARQGEWLRLVAPVLDGHEEIAAGTVGRCQVASTLGDERFVRVLVPGRPQPVTCPFDSVAFLDDSTAGP